MTATRHIAISSSLYAAIGAPQGWNALTAQRTMIFRSPSAVRFVAHRTPARSSSAIVIALTARLLGNGVGSAPHTVSAGCTLTLPGSTSRC